MRNILVIGAGKSCSYLTDYLQKKSTAEKLHITICWYNFDGVCIINGRIKKTDSCSFSIVYLVFCLEEYEKS